MNDRLTGRRLVLIGGSTGLGLSAAQAFVRHGARLVIVARDTNSLADALPTLGSNAIAIQGDACDPAVAPRAIEACLRQWNGFDGLYHVAGGSGRSHGDGPLHELTDAGLETTLHLNLHSLIYSNRAAVRQFLANHTAGAILNMGSVLATSPSPRYFATHAYTAAKSAIIGFSRSAAAYYAPHNIRINVITPALVNTPMAQRAASNDDILHYIRTKQPLDGGRVGQPSDLDDAAVFLLSDGARFVTGQVLAVDGGWSVSEGQFP